MRTLPLVALLSLAALAGCSGLVDGAGQPGDPTAETPAATATPPPGSPDADGSAVAYESLTDEQQAAVREAVNGSVRFVPDSPYVNDSAGYSNAIIDPFRGHDYVRYDGTDYEIRISSGRLYASYGIHAERGSPGENDTVVPVEDLPESVREEVREAVETGDYHAPMGRWDSLPEPLGETRYVRYDDETYRLIYAVGDYWAPVMELREVHDR
ncbi:hypothetical protein [Halomicrobium urmianum]|uniref:hypothetical protein n=1 Tax=Halomicrobium urmianum TaxID=1586233 RepID=UPI001CDA0299|nr:hypothetical protein [Halomicrobium urmianum]